jgi:hypothetical protein
METWVVPFIIGSAVVIALLAVAVHFALDQRPRRYD